MGKEYKGPTGQEHMGRFLREGQNDRDERAYHNLAAENDAGETIGGRVPGQQNMGAYINANKPPKQPAD